MPRPELCVGAVAVDRLERLLMVRRATDPQRGRWSLPGGRIEFGETMAEAVVRELFEETGMEAVCGPLLGWVERIEASHHFVIADFRVQLLDEAATPSAGTDAAEVGWIELESLAERSDLVDGLLEFLHDHGLVRTIA